MKLGMVREEQERMSQSKCEMARLRYCQKTYFGYCNANDTDVER